MKVQFINMNQISKCPIPNEDNKGVLKSFYFQIMTMYIMYDIDMYRVGINFLSFFPQIY